MNYEIIEHNGFKFLTIDRLNQLGLKNLYTLKPMDLGFKTSKDENAVRDNLHTCLEVMGAEDKVLFTSYQVHKNNVKVVDSVDEGEFYHYSRIYFETDGLVTDNKNLALYTKFADCTPVLLYDPEHHAQGNIHSGWRGTLLEIGRVGVETMVERYGTKPENLIAVVGPTIGYDDFEVDWDVAEKFQNTFSFHEDIMKRRGEKYHIDLLETNIRILKSCGLREENIISIEDSTYSNEEMHSYRRDRDNYGLMGLITTLD